MGGQKRVPKVRGQSGNFEGKFLSFFALFFFFMVFFFFFFFFFMFEKKKMLGESV